MMFVSNEEMITKNLLEYVQTSTVSFIIRHLTIPNPIGRDGNVSDDSAALCSLVTSEVL